ncbi:MAG: hypothetical protein GC171_00430 [Terrimonas sp.]|nr:hypothetical protein [Terrimonas sp.]
MQTSNYQIVIFLIVTTAIILFLIALIITFLFFYRKRQISYLQNLESIKFNNEKNLLKSQIEIQEDIFQHISREIHDNISLSLTLAKLQLNTLSWTDITKTKEQTDFTIELISKSILDLSNLSKSLSADIIKTHGLIEALEKEVEKLKHAGMFKIDMQVAGDPVYLDAGKEVIIFRIIQESFNNIIKHSQANKVSIHLHYYTDHMEMSVIDNGRGFTYPTEGKHQGSGLMNITTRALVLNGKAEIISEKAKGTHIRVSVPYNYESTTENHQSSPGR